MVKIAAWSNSGLTERLKNVLHNVVDLEDVSEKTKGRKDPISKIKICLNFMKAIKPYKYVLIYAFPKMWILILCAKIMKVQTIIYWIGTDVYHLQKKPRRYLIKKGDINIAHSASLKKELQEFNIETDVLTILPNGIDLSMGKMPDHHAVLFYIPEGREDFYGYGWISTLINQFPQLEFHIVANGKKDLFPQENAIVHGMLSPQEMEKLYDKISIVIRFPVHDSLSISIMEAMFKAKIIIYRYEQECTIQAKTLDEFIQAIKEQITHSPHPNIAAREYAISHFTEETVRLQFQYIAKKYNLEE